MFLFLFCFVFVLFWILIIDFSVHDPQNNNAREWVKHPILNHFKSLSDFWKASCNPPCGSRPQLWEPLC